MMRDLNDMAVFAKVVDEGGFTAAAKRLGLPKSNISRRVARLEAELGVRLLERTTRKLHLTEVGLIYHRHCQRMLEEAEYADICVDKHVDKPRGLLRISASTVSGQHLLGPLLKPFMTLYPEIKIQMALTNRRVDLIEEGYDLAIRVGLLEDSSLVARRLGRAHSRLYASPGYLDAQGRPKRPDELAGHDCLVMSDSDVKSKWRLDGPQHSQTIEVTPRLIVNDFSTLLQVMLADGGIALMPGYVCQELEQKGLLEPVLDNWSLPSYDYHALFPSHRGATPKVRAFLDFLVEKLALTLK